MHMLYVDDAGSANNPNEDYFVLGGVSVPESSVRWLTYQIEQLAEKINPGNTSQVEFHASDIFSGRDLWGRFSKPERINIIKSVLSILNSAYPDIVTFACAVHKKSFAHGDPMRMAFEDITSRFDLYLQRASQDNKQRGLLVFDNSAYENTLQNLAATFRKEGNKWGSYLKNICEVPLFLDSKASRIVQLADHVAYAVFRRYNAGDLNYFNQVEGRFDQDGGVVHGLSHRQTQNRNCTCPACITRR